MTVDGDGTNEVAGDTEFPVIDQCIATWNDDTASCSYLKVKDAGARRVEVKARTTRTHQVPRQVLVPARRPPTIRRSCYSESSAGITTATYVDDGGNRDGAIVDADIEINGMTSRSRSTAMTLGTDRLQRGAREHADPRARPPPRPRAHLPRSGDPPRIDGNGNPVPSCSATSDPTITEATMYPFQDCGETKKETLEPDDIAAICTIYPTAKDPATCSPVERRQRLLQHGRRTVRPARADRLLALLGLTKTRRAAAQVFCFR